MAHVGDRIIIAGSFTKMRTKSGSQVAIRRLAAVRVSTGEVDTSFAPQPSGTVFALAVSGSTIYAGGSFTSIGGASRTNLAALSSSGKALGFVANATGGEVRDIAVSGSRVYVGGGFNAVAGKARQRLAAVDASSGALQAWAPTANGLVHALTVIPGGDVVAGGKFTAVSGKARKFMARIAAGGAVSGAVFDLGSTCASAGMPCHTLDLTSDGSRVYSASGGPGGRAFAWDFAGSRKWSTAGDGDAQAVALHGGTVYVGGHFNPTFGPSGSANLHSGIVALNAANGAVSAWAPVVVGHLAVRTILADGSGLHLGGEFSTAGGTGQARYAHFAPASNDGAEPSKPSSIKLGSVAAQRVTVTWGGSTDNTGVTGYRVVRTDPNVANGQVKIWTVAASARSYTDTAVVGKRAYRYQIAAVDKSGNVSVPTAGLTVKTP